MLKYSNKFKLGFSSIEALIATSILVVGLLAIISLFPYILRANKQAELASLASAIGRAKIEQLVITSYDQLTPGNIEPRGHITADTGSQLYTFERESTITLINGSLQASQTDIGLKEIKTTVFWPNRQGGDNSLIFTSIKARK